MNSQLPDNDDANAEGGSLEETITQKVRALPVTARPTPSYDPYDMVPLDKSTVGVKDKARKKPGDLRKLSELITARDIEELKEFKKAQQDS